MQISSIATCCSKSDGVHQIDSALLYPALVSLVLTGEGLGVLLLEGGGSFVLRGQWGIHEFGSPRGDLPLIVKAMDTHEFVAGQTVIQQGNLVDKHACRSG